MSFTIFPYQTSHYQSEWEPDKLIAILKENTFEGSLSSTAHQTSKRFIGEVEGTTFKIIASARPTSMLCVLEGRLNENGKDTISITKRFHPTFRNLFAFWAIALFTIPLILPGTVSQKITHSILFLVFTSLIRYLLISFLYRNIEKEAMQEVETILKLKEV
jgi:hypothetical protein